MKKVVLCEEIKKFLNDVDSRTVFSRSYEINKVCNVNASNYSTIDSVASYAFTNNKFIYLSEFKHVIKCERLEKETFFNIVRGKVYLVDSKDGILVINDICILRKLTEMPKYKVYYENKESE